MALILTVYECVDFMFLLYKCDPMNFFIICSLSFRSSKYTAFSGLFLLGVLLPPHHKLHPLPVPLSAFSATWVTGEMEEEGEGVVGSTLEP